MVHFTVFIRTFAASDTSLNERGNGLYNKKPLEKSGRRTFLPRGAFFSRTQIESLPVPRKPLESSSVRSLFTRWSG